MTSTYDIDPLAYLDPKRGLQDVWFVAHTSASSVAVHYKDGTTVHSFVNPSLIGRTLDAVQDLIDIHHDIAGE